MNLIAILTSFLLFTRASCKGGFITPPGLGNPYGDFSDNPRYQIGHTLKLEWEQPNPDIAYVDIKVFQLYPAVLTGSQSNAWNWVARNLSTEKTMYDWKISTKGLGEDADVNLEDVERVWWIDVHQPNHVRREFMSHFFNVTNEQIPEATQTTQKPTSTSKPTSSSAAESASNSLGNEGRLSTGQIAGIAVGSTAGCLLLAAAAFMIWRRSRGNEVKATEVFEKGHDSVVFKPSGTHEVEATQKPHELEGCQGTVSPMDSRYSMFSTVPEVVHEAP